ncbi:hypothetical protein Hanom_Chr05g00390061 [Helianthus anomalus]
MCHAHRGRLAILVVYLKYIFFFLLSFAHHTTKTLSPVCYSAQIPNSSPNLPQRHNIHGTTT